MASSDSGDRRAAAGALGVRVAVMGKGGAGKTVICATLARHLARRGRSVLAVDLDTNPGLALSLGLGGAEPGLGIESLEEHGGAPYGWQLAGGLSPPDAVDRHALAGPDGVRFLTVGKIGAVDKLAAKRSLSAVTELVLDLATPDLDVVVDLEGGPSTPFQHYHAFADTVVLPVGPAWRSAMTVRRLLPMVGERRTVVVANRYRDEADHPGLAPQVRIPFDPCVAAAERRGVAPLDACPESPAMIAVDALAGRILNQEVPA